jgi:PTH1 family peptidyl-tRNA hydrolase
MANLEFNPWQKVFFGLGNPVDEYGNTYHNIGAKMLFFLSGTDPENFITPSRKHFAYVQKGSVVFARNKTYMNESGVAARELLAYFKRSHANLVVLHDDSDMTVGTYKLSFNQRSAGHHGIDSIIAGLGTSEFWRLKIGIRPAEEVVRKKAEEFVLKKISPVDEEIFEKVFTEITSDVFPVSAEQ